jgi:hypothetical protein
MQRREGQGVGAQDMLPEKGLIASCSAAKVAEAANPNTERPMPG